MSDMLQSLHKLCLNIKITQNQIGQQFFAQVVLIPWELVNERSSVDWGAALFVGQRAVRPRED